MRLDLNDREVEVLVEIVRERVGEYASEIHHAATSTFRDELRDRKRSLEDLLEKLQVLAA